MTNNDVIRLFIQGETKGKTAHLKIEGDKLINYTTAIAYRVAPDMYLINGEHYSRTTSTIQNSLKRHLESASIEFSISEGESDFMENMYSYINE